MKDSNKIPQIYGIVTVSTTKEGRGYRS